MPVECVCELCHNHFELPPSAVAKGKGRFCSKECYDKSRRNRTKCTCQHCGREFFKKPCDVKRGKGLFCSTKCRHSEPRPDETCQKISKALKGKYMGKLHPNWHGGTSFAPYCGAFNWKLKEEIRDRFGRTCYLCGATENGKKLDVHHCDYNKSQGCKGLKWSLIPLCHSCHMRTNNQKWHWFPLLRDYWLNE